MSSHHRSPTWTVLAAALALAAPVAGQDDPALAALVAEALERNPDLEALEEAASAARSRPEQARALPDPMISVSYRNDGWRPTLGEEPMTNLAFMASQDLPWPGKRGLRADVAARQAEQVAQQLARGRLSVAASVRRAYHGLRQARLLRELVREQGELWGQIEGVARARYTVGQGAQQDVLRTQIERTRIGQLEAEQQADEAVRLAELNRWAGRPADADVETASATGLTPAAPPLAATLDRLHDVSPELAAARAAVEEARLRVALAKTDFRPDLKVEGGYMNRGALEPMWQVAVGISLPRRGPRKAALAEAEARLRAAERRLEAASLQLRFRTQERLARLTAIERMALLYEEGIVPQDRLSVEAAIASYQTGRVPFVSVLEALGTLYADRSAYVRLLAAQGQTRASLEEASLEGSPEMPAMPAAGMGGAAETTDRPMGGMR